MPLAPDLTVIIPAKIRSDQELDWLMACLWSVVRQKDCKPAILVGNDHSPFPIAVEMLAKLHKNIRLTFYDLPEGVTGLAANRNYLVAQVKTKFFFPLDADDLLPPEALKIALDAYPGDGFLYGSTIMFDKDGHTLFPAQPYDFSKLLTQVYWPSGALQLTENWAKVKWDETLSAYEDWDYWIRSGEAGICGHALSSVLYWYRRNPQGIISKLNSDPSVKQKAVDRIREKHSKLYQGGIQMCCGRDGISVSLNQQSQQALAGLPGAEGFVTIEYQGGNSGDMSWFGTVTGTRYVAGGITRLVSVDVRDALTGASKKPGLLELVEYGKYIFKEYTEPVTEQSIPQVEPVAQAVETTSPDGLVANAGETDVDAALKTSGRKSKAATK
jgi:hypothetical protein